MSNPLLDVAQLIISAVFSIFMFIVALRLILQIVSADFRNDISQGVIKITNPILVPMRRIIPGFGGIDMASVILLYALQIIEIVLLFVLIGGKDLSIPGVLLLAVAFVIKFVGFILFFAIIIRIIISWINPGGYNPILSLLISVTEPLMAPARRILPPLGGFDFSPILVLLVMQILYMLLIIPLTQFAVMI